MPSPEAPNYQWPEDHGHLSGDIGNFVLGVRNDADIVFTDNDLDYTPIALDASGAVKVVVGGEPLDIRPLTCVIDSITTCPPVGGFLDCITDSVTICPGVDPIPVTPPNLDCTTDSVTICPGLDPIIIVATDLDIRPLTCLEDSITICPGIDPIVIVATDLDIRPLTCATDSVTICPGVDPIPVTPPHLDCTTDSVTACIDTPITIVPGKRPLLGLYYGTSGPIAYTSAADAATGGDIWLVNTSALVIAYIREVRFTVVINDLALLTALPTIRMERMTFTGVPSGATITPANRDSTDAVNTATLRTANTGMVITPGAAIRSFAPPSADVIGGLLSANAAVAVPTEQILQLDIDGFIALRQNEGVVFRQNTAGSTPENRFYWLNIAWEEI